MSLLSKDINFILNLLNEDTCGTNLTFDQISTQFQHGINKHDYLKVGNALVLLLQNRDLTPTSQQRLIILYLFFDMYKIEPLHLHTNPFAPVFLTVLYPSQTLGSMSTINDTNNDTTSTATVQQKRFHWIISKVTSHERWFVHTLMSGSSTTKDLLKKTPNQILQMPLPSSPLFDDSNHDYFKQQVIERTKQLPLTAQCHLPAVIDDPETNKYNFDTLFTRNGALNNNNIKDDYKQVVEKLFIGQKPSMEQTIRPEFLRLVPPLHISLDCDELIWMNPIENDNHMVAWDGSMCITNKISIEIRQLMDKAYMGQLNLQQQQKLLDELETDPCIVYHIGLTPSKLPSLVENSPLIAIQCLLKLMPSNQLTEYLSSLVNMDMSLHSMEVVNRLTTSIDLPQEFLHLYISTCVTTCENTKDRFLQNRFVRLVSVFIQSLIRNKVIDVKDLFLEVQGFCIGFRHIKEAAALFQLVKKMDSNNNNNNNGNGNSHTITTEETISSTEEPMLND
ncbi:unnamed protein product [Didymodactylos carnosus]|uniref:CCR4-NOT transcription complex subunit 11 n=1 Tax=Didymodactylos carnosus TaxID=1234261 RepID=A0A814GF61_9BILA|nr:unnamed protein product [Didymodactylos carnosus]CAF1064105.1 unnamed protein product [Didymodactylos carnosus]CAF3767196.1 unnamed protein product [Didymodactylos carnosus]CAF3829374.1 unnamed protein product [Didymodactylos carnosus]